ncbi:MAG: glutamate synthase subunit beta [Calditrichia bacterium]|nr:glutamate synthase subunit beta [Calditrichia bacterium]
MGKPTGFLEQHRKEAAKEPVRQRLGHYREFTTALESAELSTQGSRCMDCGIPFCHSSFGCPVNNLIPEWNDLVYRDLWHEAYKRLEMTNNFPEFTGRVCPAPCETACTLSLNDTSVTIKQLELAIIEKAFEKNWVKPIIPDFCSGKKVAVIGSGPAGLAAAQQLRRMGHEVTIFEKSLKAGGILRYGIPDFKLEKSIIDRRLDQLKKEGIRFETNVNIGEDISARYLQKTFDVVLLTIGAGQPRNLPVPGRELNGIHLAMDYLTAVNKYVEGSLNENEIISAKDKNVLVIGGGDTGSDCVGIANRQGAKNVYQFEILPKPREWNNSWNPEWPNWPNIIRTSTSHEEGCKQDWSIQTESFEGNNGQLKKGHFKRLEWNTSTDGKMQMEELPGTDFTMDVDLVFLAMGFVHVEHNRLLSQLSAAFDERANIKIDENYMTSVKGIFSAGDAQTGPSLVVRAIDHGRRAAEAIDWYLKDNITD